MKKTNKGFTLMEMLIVIAIIAILIAIAIPTFTSALEKSKQRTDMANVRSLKSLAVADYMADGGVIPASKTTYDCYLVKGGQSFITGTPNSNCVTIEAKWSGADPAYTTGDYITLKIDTANNGQISGTHPKLADDVAT